MSTKVIIATNTVLSDNPEGTRTLTIQSKTETIVVEFSPAVWEMLAETAKWFHDPSSVQESGTSLTMEQMKQITEGET